MYQNNATNANGNVIQAHDDHHHALMSGYEGATFGGKFFSLICFVFLHYSLYFEALTFNCEEDLV